MTAKFRSLNGALGNLDGRLTSNDRQCINRRLNAELTELFLRCRTTRIKRRHQHLLALTLREALGKLTGGGRLTRTLQTNHHNDDRCRRIQINRDTFSAQHFDKLVVDDLDDHLTGLDALEDFCTDSLFADLVSERTNHFQRDIGFNQRTTHFAQRSRHVAFRESAASGQAVQNGAKTLLK